MVLVPNILLIYSNQIFKENLVEHYISMLQTIFYARSVLKIDKIIITMYH
jgi:hypothetical protein